jgi:signal transduction histidine kinase
MRRGLRSQLLGALVLVLLFGLLTTWLVGGDLTRGAVLAVRSAEARRLVEMIRAHLDGSANPEAAMARARLVAAPHPLKLVAGVDSGCPVAPPEGGGAEVVAEEERLVAAALLSDGRRVCLTASLDPELQRLDRAQTVGLLFLLLTAALAMVLGYLLLGRAVVRPVTRLMHLAERIGAGEVVPVRAPTGASDEITRLFDSVGEMTRGLQADRAQMETRLAELRKAHAALEATQAQLLVTEKLASVGKLAAGVAHEIGNPVSVLQGYVELMAHPAELSVEDRQRYLGAMQSSVERISSIIRDLLDFARPSEEAAPGCDVVAVVGHVAKLLAPHKAFKELRLVVTVPQAPLMAKAHAGRLEQVLVNLLFNAADASPRGGVARLEAARDGEQVVVSVEDEGPGIPPADRTRVFDPFYTTKEPGAGTGLGLAICHGIVTGYGGTIEVDPAPRRGARFEVRLPREA